MIYFIRKPDRSAIKIGTTIRLSQRLKQLVAEHGEGLEVLAVADGSYDREEALHGRFSHLRLAGEWFEPGNELVDFIAAEGRPWKGEKFDDEDPATSQARLELPSEDMERVRHAARNIGLNLSAFIRQSVLEKTVDVTNRMGLRL